MVAYPGTSVKRLTTPSLRRVRRSAKPTLAGLVALVLIASGLGGSGAVPQLGAQTSPTAVTPNSAVPGGPTTTIKKSTVRPGRVAYATPGGDVVVAESDGSTPLVIGTDAATNRVGLAPLAWSPAGDVVAYVRGDKALVLASTDNSDPPRVVATDAIVPPDADESILSFDVTGSSIAYIAETDQGDAAKLVTFDGEGKDKPAISLSDPVNRVPLELQYSPLDPFLLLRSADPETGREFTIALVEPSGGTPFASPFTADDPAFAPDGSAVYGVVVKGISQIIRIDTATGRTSLVHDQDRICNPRPSPDGTKLVYAAGPTCSEVWTISSDGNDAKKIADHVGGTSTFSTGMFSWSLDGKLISHAACKGDGATATCSGAYWDIPTDGRKVVSRAVAGSVVREYRALIKAIKVKIEITGPVTFSDRLLVSAKSTGSLLQVDDAGTADVSAVDQRDARRSFSLKLVKGADSRWIEGSVRVQDPSGFDQTFTILGSILVSSYRAASLRSIYLQTTSFPFKTGRLDLTVYR